MNKEKLREVLESKLGSLGIRKAIIIDDVIGETNSVIWSELVSVLGKEDSDSYERFLELSDEEGTGSLDELPPDNILSRYQTIADTSSSSKASELAKKLDSGNEVEDLKLFLESLGLDVDALSAPPVEVPDVQLCFVDYQLTPEKPDSAGLDASAFLNKMSDKLNAKVPATVLMSRKIDDEPGEIEWEDVAKRGAFLRLKYRFLDKSTIADEISLMLFLNNLISTYTLGEKYADSISSFKEVVSVSVDNASNILYALKPSDFHAFSNSLGKVATGNPSTDYTAYHNDYMVEHLVDIFNDLVNQEMHNDGNLKNVIQKFHDVLSATELPSEIQSVEPLHEVYARVLYNRNKYVLNGPIAFGDIFSDSVNNFWLVLTPECDLELHNQAMLCPKVQKVLLVKGVRSLKAETISFPFPDKEKAWINWFPSCPRFVNHSTLINGRSSYEKWGRLRTQEAESIQYKFASNFLRVGTADIPGPTAKFSLHVWRKGEPYQYIGNDVLLSRFPIAAKQYDHVSLPATVWTKLSSMISCEDAELFYEGLKFLPLKEFRNLLSKMRIGLVEPLSNINQLTEKDCSDAKKKKVLKKYKDSYHLVIGVTGTKLKIPVETLLSAEI